MLECCPENIKRQGQQDGNHRVKSIEPAQLRILGPFGNIFVAGGKIGPGGQPADMAPPEAMQAGRVDILLLIRVAVVMTMMGGPPQRASLDPLPMAPKINCQVRLVLNALCEKYRW